MGIFILIVILGLIYVFVKRCVKFVPESQFWVIERAGKFYKVWEPGLNIKAPYFDRIAKKIPRKEREADFKPQTVITKDRISLKIDAVIFYRIIDAQKYAYTTENPLESLEKITIAIFRSYIAGLIFEEATQSRKVINSKVSADLKEPADRMGIEILGVEMKNMEPPKDFIEAVKNRKIAEQKKQAMILEAQGQAEAVTLVQKANAESISLLREAGADDRVLALKGFETLAKVAEGKATKIIIPSELQNVGGTLMALKEITKDDIQPAKTAADIQFTPIESRKIETEEPAEEAKAEDKKTEDKKTDDEE